MFLSLAAIAFGAGLIGFAANVVEQRHHHVKKQTFDKRFAWVVAIMYFGLAILIMRLAPPDKSGLAVVLLFTCFAVGLLCRALVRRARLRRKFDYW